MSFLAPWALVLGVAALFPLLLHLLRRRTGARIDFPAVRYLLRAEKEHSREVKLRNLLLMFLRIAIVLSIAFAAARPLVRMSIPLAGHPPTALALVLDNSLSSSLVGDDGSILARLAADAGAVLDAAGRSDVFWLVTVDGGVVSGERNALKDALGRVRHVDGRGDAEGAVRRAVSLVSDSDLPEKRVVILTDGQVTQWEGVVLNGDIGQIKVAVRQLSEDLSNSYVRSAVPEPMYWNPRGVLRGAIVGGDSTTWRVNIADRTEARGSIARGSDISVALQPIAKGWLAGSLEIAPDELRGDDVSYFAVHAGSPPSVGIDLAPNSGPFIGGALDALVSSGRVVRGGEAWLTTADRARSNAVIFAPADPVGIVDANRGLARAGIPWRFSAPRRGSAPLVGEGIEGVVARLWYALTPEGEAADIDTLVRVGLEPWSLAGDGYVIVASPATAEGTDLPLRAAFVPWLAGLVNERLSAGVGSVIAPGPAGTVRVPNGVDSIENPDGTLSPVSAGTEFEFPFRAGVYFWLKGDVRSGAVVINPEPDESILTPLASDSLAQLLGAPSVALSSEELVRSVFAASGTRPAATSLLVLALLLIAAESVVARRGLFSR